MGNHEKYEIKSLYDNILKTMMDALEALADAKTGEMERLKEFGFKVTAEEFKGFVGKGKNDTLTDDETNKAYNTLVNKKLNPYFAGGAEKISNTTGGKISTIQGNIQSGFAEAGTNMLKAVDPKILDKLVKSSAKLGTAIGKLGAKMITAFSKVAPHIKAISKAIIITIAAVASFKIALAGLKIISSIIKLFKLWRAGALTLNMVLAANPLGLIALAIAAVIAAGVALYLNWDKVKKKCKELWKDLKTYFGKIRDSVKEKLQPLLDFFKNLMKKWDDFKTSVKNFKMPSISIGKPKILGGEGLVQLGKKKAIGGVIPRDNYPALLHEGERVQTKQEVHQDNRKQGNTYHFGNIIIQGSGYAKLDAKNLLRSIVSELEMSGGAGA